MMNKVMIICLLIGLLLLLGCAEIKNEIPLPDGRVIKNEYRRVANQQIGLFTITVHPDGTVEARLEGQKSDTEIIFNAGRASVGVTTPD